MEPLCSACRRDRLAREAWLPARVAYRETLAQPRRAPPSARESRLDVLEIGPERARLYEEVVARPLGVPPELGPGICSTLGHPGWRFYLAFDGERPVAGGASYRDGDCAWFGLAATRSDDRRRGAQTALLRRRLEDAAGDGCRWATADTPADTPERPNPSYQNMRQLGFALLYERPNYLGP